MIEVLHRTLDKRIERKRFPNIHVNVPMPMFGELFRLLVIRFDNTIHDEILYQYMYHYKGFDWHIYTDLESRDVECGEDFLEQMTNFIKILNQ